MTINSIGCTWHLEVEICLWSDVTYCQVLPRAIIGLILILNAFVFSNLFYCSSVWCNTSKTNVKKMQLVQNFASRIVLGLQKYDHVFEGLKSLRWLPIAEKLLLNVSVMVHKCLNGRSTDYL